MVSGTCFLALTMIGTAACSGRGPDRVEVSVPASPTGTIIAKPSTEGRIVFAGEDGEIWAMRADGHEAPSLD